MAMPHAYKILTVHDSHKKVAYVTGEVGGVTFRGYPDRTLVFEGKVTDQEREAARKCCRQMMGR